VVGPLAGASFTPDGGETEDLTPYLRVSEQVAIEAARRAGVPAGLLARHGDPNWPGRFIAVEGGEGAGKSTQARRLADVLRVRYGREVLVTREPGATPMGAILRKMVLGGKVPSRAELLLFLADRALHIEQVIVPALNEGKVVISDRHAGSSIAYQGAGRGFGEDAVAWMSNFATAGIAPDLTVLLDVHPSIGLARAARRGDVNRMEGEELAFHRVVRASFQRQAADRPDRWAIVPVLLGASEEQIAAQVEYVVADRLGLEQTGEVDVAARR